MTLSEPDLHSCWRTRLCQEVRKSNPRKYQKQRQSASFKEVAEIDRPIHRKVNVLKGSQQILEVEEMDGSLHTKINVFQGECSWFKLNLLSRFSFSASSWTLLGFAVIPFLVPLQTCGWATQKGPRGRSREFPWSVNLLQWYRRIHQPLLWEYTDAGALFISCSCPSGDNRQ